MNKPKNHRIAECCLNCKHVYEADPDLNMCSELEYYCLINKKEKKYLEHLGKHHAWYIEFYKTKPLMVCNNYRGLFEGGVV